MRDRIECIVETSEEDRDRDEEEVEDEEGERGRGGARDGRADAGLPADALSRGHVWQYARAH